MALKTSTTTDDILALAKLQINKLGVSTNIVSTGNAVITDKGIISIGITPPSNFGNNEGIYIGYDNGPQLSLYSNENNFLKWDGNKLLIQSENFTLDSLGNITAFNANLSGSIIAQSGSIAGWIIRDDVLYSGSGSVTVILDSSGSHPSISAGSSVSDTAPFRVYPDGRVYASNADISGSITAISGSIGGWSINATNIFKNNVILDSSGEITLGTGDNVIKLSSIDPSGYALWAGNANPVNAPFTVSATGNVKIRSGEVTGTFQSSNFVSGLSGWQVKSDGKAEFQDARVRGTIETAVFEMEQVSVQSGTQWISEGSALVEDVSPSSVTVTVLNRVFTVNDYIRIKTATQDEWMLVLDEGTLSTNGWSYIVNRGLNGTLGTFQKGQAVVRLGQLAVASVIPENLGSGSAAELGSGSSTDFLGVSQATTGGFLVLEGSRTTGPYFGVTTRTGTAYNDLQDIIRLGMLRDYNITPAFGEVYGIVIGDTNRYFAYTREGGLKIVNTIGNSVVIDDSGLTLDLTEYKMLSGTVPSPTSGYMNLYFKDDEFLYSKTSAGVETKIAGGGTTTSSGCAILKEIATPTAPGSGSVVLYAKSDKNAYAINSDGVESQVSGSYVTRAAILLTESSASIPASTGSTVLYAKTGGNLFMASGSVESQLAKVDTEKILLYETAGSPTTPTSGCRVLFPRADGWYDLSSAGSPTRILSDSNMTYPKRFSIMGDEIRPISPTSASSLIYTAVDVQLYNGVWNTAAANANNGDKFTFGVFLAAGTYTFYHMGRSQPEAGKLDWYVDEVLVASGRDWYAGTAAFKLDSFSVAVLTSGYHTILMQVNGKHASSTDYRTIITKIWGMQATD